MDASLVWDRRAALAGPPGADRRITIVDVKRRSSPSRGGRTRAKLDGWNLTAIFRRAIWWISFLVGRVPHVQLAPPNPLSWVSSRTPNRCIPNAQRVMVIHARVKVSRWRRPGSGICDRGSSLAPDRGGSHGICDPGLRQSRLLRWRLGRRSGRPVRTASIGLAKIFAWDPHIAHAHVGYDFVRCKLICGSRKHNLRQQPATNQPDGQIT